jgi:hypothetical protein
MLKCVVTRNFNRVENREPAFAEHFQVNAQEWFDGLCERKPRLKKSACAFNQGFHERHVARVELSTEDISFG